MTIFRLNAVLVVVNHHHILYMTACISTSKETIKTGYADNHAGRKSPYKTIGT